jgi:asparagine synthase (glutamine-hydrolysing)
MSYEASPSRESLGGISTPGQLAALWGTRTDLLTAVALQRAQIEPGSLNAYDVFAASVDEAERAKMRDRWHPLHSALSVQQKTMLPNLLCCHLGDRSEMAHSVEGRPPFLCHKLTEYVNSLPPSMKLRLPTEKWILREAARPFVTHEVYSRTKQPFCSPPNSSTGPFADLIRQRVTAESVSSLGWMDWVTVEEILKEFNSEGTPVSRNCLCMILSYIMLGEAFSVQKFI